MTQRILVVEDEPAIADTISYALTTDGFEPLCCSTGQDALELLQRGNIALVVLDVGLPDINGFELAKQLWAISPVPVIFLTARSGEVDRVVGLELGADDYISKPFSPRELTARIRTVLRRVGAARPSSSTNVTTQGPFVIDDEKKKIFYRGKELDLARYEFKILKVFIGRPGKVFSRDELMDRVWDEPESSMDRTVDAHIKSIRAKLREIAPDEDPIKTHRGLGYSLKEYV